MPHTIGGALADQFSWYVIFFKNAVCFLDWSLYIGTMIMSLASGSMKDGCRKLLLSLHDLTTQLTWSNVQTDCVSSL